MCHPEASRPLSVLECAALQGFPSQWTFDGAMNSRYMQVGNAVPVELGLALGEALIRYPANRLTNERSHRDTNVMVTTAINRLRAAGRNKRQAKAA